MFENIRERLTPSNLALGSMAFIAVALAACGTPALIHHFNPNAVLHIGDLYFNSTGVLLDGCNSGFVQSIFGAQMTSYDWSNVMKGIQDFSSGCV